MIHLWNACKFENCNKYATSNFIGLKKKIYCGAHRIEGMRTVVTNTCPIDGCYFLPKFNFSTENVGK